MDEKYYRNLISQTIARVNKALESVDPDLVECEDSQGALVLKFASGAKCILSAQPSVRQLWIAAAAKGVAYHFNWDEESKTWLDDRGKGIEALSFLETHISEGSGLSIKI